MRRSQQRQGTTTWTKRALVVVVAAGAVLPSAGLSSSATATFPASPALSLERTLPTSPFAASTLATVDHEGSAFVPRDNSVWLADDDGRAVYEINASTGVLKRRIRGDKFAEVRRFGGHVRAGKDRTQEIQALSYDQAKDTLYVFAGTCCPPRIRSTAFRMTRTSSGRLKPDSFQPLAGLQVEGSAWDPRTGSIYIGSHNTLWKYAYARNAVGRDITIPGVTGIYGLDFTNDGRDLFIARPPSRVTRVDWASRTIVPGWDLDLAAFGPLDVRGVEVVRQQLWVSDGSDSRASGDPLAHALFIFRWSD